MSDDRERRPPDEDGRTGEAIAELAALREPAPAGFLDRVRGSIQRRLLVAQTADFSLRVLAQTMFEYLTAVVDAFRGPQPPKQGSD